MQHPVHKVTLDDMREACRDRTYHECKEYVERIRRRCLEEGTCLYIELPLGTTINQIPGTAAWIQLADYVTVGGFWAKNRDNGQVQVSL